MNKKKSSLAINAVLNVIKQCCMIVFPMITFPYASRVLGVENYGKINFGTSVISYISLIAALGINNYAIREGSRIKDDKHKLKRFANDIYSINFISMIFAYVILGLMLSFWGKLSNYKSLIIIQSLVVFFTTVGTDWINVIYEDYLFITIRYIICQLIAISAMFLFVHDEKDYIIYAFTSILGTILANGFNIIHIRKRMGIFFKFEISRNIKEHFAPIMTIFGSSIATLIYINSDITILGILKDDITVGYYSVSVKIYSLVKQLVNAFLVVAIPRFSREILIKDSKDIRKQLNVLLIVLLVIVGPIVTGIFIMRENLITLFAGKDYIQGSDSLAILSVSLFFATVACYYINVVMLPRRMEKQILIATTVSALINIILNVILIPYFGALAAAFTTAISEFVMMIMGIFYTKEEYYQANIKTLIAIGAGISWTWIFCEVSLMMNFNNFIVICLAVIGSGVGVVILNYFVWRKELNIIILNKMKSEESA